MIALSDMQVFSLILGAVAFAWTLEPNSVAKAVLGAAWRAWRRYRFAPLMDELNPFRLSATFWELGQ